jgi:hypothetical protein
MPAILGPRHRVITKRNETMDLSERPTLRSADQPEYIAQVLERPRKAVAVTQTLSRANTRVGSTALALFQKGNPRLD